MFDMVIWSKDRAMQCDALLRSMIRNRCDYHMKSTAVLWTGSSDSFKDGYRALVERWDPFHEWISFREEGSFKKDILGILDYKFTSEYVLGNSDDNLFINPFPKKFNAKLVGDEHAISFRLNKTVDYCQPASLNIEPPTLYRSFWMNEFGSGNGVSGQDYHLFWNWKDADPHGCWGYPNPCDSNMYRRKWWIDLLKDADFKNPFTMEIYMNDHRNAARPIMKCFDKSVLVNVCNNCVQDTGNPCGGQSQEFLNDQWLSGKQIDINPFMGMQPTQCHILKDFKFEGRPDK